MRSHVGWIELLLGGEPTGAEKTMREPETYRIELPARRYAIFESLLRGQYAIVVRGADIEYAPKWGGFVAWLGGEKEATVSSVQHWRCDMT